MALSDLLNKQQGQAPQQPAQPKGLASLLAKQQSQDTRTPELNQNLDFGGSQLRPASKMDTGSASPFQKFLHASYSPDSLAEQLEGLKEGAVPFGLGRVNAQVPGTMPAAFIDEQSFFNKNNIRSPRLDIAIKGRKLGRLAGSLMRYEKLDSAMKAAAGPLSLLATKTGGAAKKAEPYIRAILSGAAGFGTDNPPEDEETLAEISKGVLARAGLGALAGGAATAAFRGISALDRKGSLDAIRQARDYFRKNPTTAHAAVESTDLGIENPALKNYTRALAKFRAKRLSRLNAFNAKERAELAAAADELEAGEMLDRLKYNPAELDDAKLGEELVFVQGKAQQLKNPRAAKIAQEHADRLGREARVREVAVGAKKASEAEAKKRARAEAIARNNPDYEKQMQQAYSELEMKVDPERAAELKEFAEIRMLTPEQEAAYVKANTPKGNYAQPDVKQPKMATQKDVPEPQGPVFAIVKTDGSVVSRKGVVSHVQVAERAKVKLDEVSQTGFVVDGKFVATERMPAVKAIRDEMHKLGNELQVVMLELSELRQVDPTNPKLDQLSGKSEFIRDQLDKKMLELNHVLEKPDERGFIRLMNARTTAQVPPPSGTGLDKPAILGAMAEKPKQFPQSKAVNARLADGRNKVFVQGAQHLMDTSGKTGGRVSLSQILAKAKKDKASVHEALQLLEFQNLPPDTPLNATDLTRLALLVNDAAESVRTNLRVYELNPRSPVAKTNAIHSLMTLKDLLSAHAGAGAALGRAMRAAREGYMMLEMTTPRAMSVLDSINDEMSLATMQELVRAMDAGNAAGVGKAMDNIRKAGLFSKAVDLSNALLLTSLKTFEKNVIGNITVAMLMLGDTAVGGATDKGMAMLQRRPRAVYASEAWIEAMSIWDGALAGATDVMTLFSRIPRQAKWVRKWLEKQPQGDKIVKQFDAVFDKLGERPVRFTDIAPGSTVMQELFGEAPELAKAIYFPLNTTDIWFKMVKWRMSINAQAYRMARVEGLKQGSIKFIERFESLKKEPTERMVTEADARALEATLQEGLGEILGLINRIRYVRGFGPLIRLLVPFLKTPVNSARTGFKHGLTAFAMPRENAKIFGNAPDFPLENARPSDLAQGQSMALGRILFGSVLQLIAVQLTLKGAMTGSKSKDYGKERLHRAMGRLPHALRLQLSELPFGVPGAGDKDAWISYRTLESFAYIVEPVVTATQRWMERSPAEKAKGITVDTAFQSAIDTGTFTFETSAMRSTGELMDAYGGRNPEFFSKMVGSRIAIPGISMINQLFFDHVVRLPELEVPENASAAYKFVAPILQQVMARTPGQSQKLPPMVDARGQEIRSSGLNPIDVSQVNDDPALKELLRVEVNISRPSKDFFKGIQLSPLQQATLEQESNPLVLQIVNKAIQLPGYGNLNLDSKRKVLKAIIRTTRMTSAVRLGYITQEALMAAKAEELKNANQK